MVSRRSVCGDFGRGCVGETVEWGRLDMNGGRSGTSGLLRRGCVLPGRLAGEECGACRRRATSRGDGCIGGSESGDVLVELGSRRRKRWCRSRTRTSWNGWWAPSDGSGVGGEGLRDFGGLVESCRLGRGFGVNDGERMAALRTRWAPSEGPVSVRNVVGRGADFRRTGLRACGGPRRWSGGV